MIRDGIRRAFRLALFRRDRWEAEVEEEIKLHLLLRAEELAKAGAAPKAAWDEAVRRFGPLNESRARLLNAARHREQHMQRAEFFDNLRQDLTFAVRTVRRQKAWTAVTLLTFALGIGATAAVFSVVSSLLLHPLPYPDASRVVFIDEETTGSNGRIGNISISIRPSADVVRAWLAASRSFEDIEPYGSASASLETTGEPAEVDVGMIRPTFLRFAGERPLVGRLFTEAEIRSKAHLVLLGERAWRTRFGSDPTVLGRAITLDDTLYTIVGVLPATLRLPNEAANSVDVWTPINIADDNANYTLVARLRPGVTTQSAARELDALIARSESAPAPLGNVVDRRAGASNSGTSSAQTSRFSARVSSPGSLLRIRDTLMMLMAAAGLVLLIACANVAHLLLVRGASRERELSIRAALGAGTARVFRQLLTETALLTVAGGAAGLALGWFGLGAMVSMRPDALSELDRARLDTTTLIAAGLVTAASAILFGILAVRRRGAASEALKAGAVSVSAAKRHDRLRSVLVVSEMAFSATLLVGATLMIRSVINLQNADLGFEPKGLYSLRVVVPSARYGDSTSLIGFKVRLARQLRSVPGVVAVTEASSIPGYWRFNIGALEVQGEAPPPPHTTSFINNNDVDPDYFRTMGIRIIEGSTFTDTSANANQVIVNQVFARKHWPPGQAVGHLIRIAFNGTGTWKTIVGVAADARTGGALADMSAPLLYYPPGTNDASWRGARAGGVTGGSFLIRGSGDTKTASAISRAVAALEPRSKSTVERVERTMGRAIAADRFVMVLLTSFTGLALLLAAVGLYGVMAYAVAERTREIGIRIALGASRGSITRLIATRGVGLAAVGALLGLAGALWGTKLIEHTLHGVARTDPVSFTVGGLFLLATAALACVVPARRALAVDPVNAIKAD